MLNITDSNNSLFINGDINGEYKVSVTDLIKQANSGQNDYDMYTGNGVILYIDTDITNIGI